MLVGGSNPDTTYCETEGPSPAISLMFTPEGSFSWLMSK